ncbi:MAG: hypothetical protein OJJ54_13475, partial [Pseudonocardia sp.]|nr:hypothetical protein [Pseudonocardia sp.]
MAGEGFRIASAYVDVRAEDNTRAGVASARRAVESLRDKTVKVKVEADTKGFEKNIGSFFTGATKGLLAVGTLANASSAVAGLGSALVGLSGTLLALPAAALAGGAAMGTLKLATAGFGDALKEMEDPAKFAEAIGKLAPAARETAIAMRDLQPAFRDMQRSVQDDFFYGFADVTRQLGATYLPLLKTELSGVALQMGQVVSLAGKALLEPSAIKNVNSLLQGTTDLFDGLKTVGADVLTAFLDLGGVGSQYLGRLGVMSREVGQPGERWAAA